MGLLQTSAADGMGRAHLDVGASAHQLVVSVDGVDQCGNRVVGCRSDFAPLRQGRQESDRAAALDDAADLPASRPALQCQRGAVGDLADRSEEHTSELQSRRDLVCRLLLEKKKQNLRGAWCLKQKINIILYIETVS